MAGRRITWLSPTRSARECRRTWWKLPSGLPSGPRTAITSALNSGMPFRRRLPKAAERGYGGAQNNLAIAYALGQGVPKDLVEASKWFALGAAHGDNQRAELRDAIQKKVAPAQIAEAEKRVKEFRPGK